MMPRGGNEFIEFNKWEPEFGFFLPYANKKGIPQLRLTRNCRRHLDSPDFNMIFDIKNDPGQTKPVRDNKLEKMLADKMKALLNQYAAPESQYQRLGL